MEKKKRGRPKKHATALDRVRAYRQRKKGQERRLDGYINSPASWRLTCLSKAWGCSQAAAVERLILEADERYKNILFPET